MALVAVLAVLGYGLWAAGWPRTFAAALAELVDGDADLDERRHCLQIVRDHGLAQARAGDARAGVLAAMAALALDELPGFENAWALADGKVELSAELCATAELGEPCLHPLLSALQAERAGQRAAALDHFRRAAASAALAKNAAARRVAEAGMLRAQ